MQDDPTLRRLLEEMRAALLRGDLLCLRDILPRMSAACEPAPPLNSAEREVILAMAEGNARLLAAALEGTASARRRLEEMRRAASATTYDSCGRLDRMSSSNPRPGRRV